jgi:hypothetical protein
MRMSLDVPAGIFSDDTTYSSAGRWWSCSNVRFWRGLPQVLGGWERAVEGSVGGTCRNIFTWTDAEAELHVGFGSHSHLQVWKGSDLIDITPPGLPAGLTDTVPGAGFGIGTYGAGDYSEPQFDAAKLRTWSLAAWGERLLASPRGEQIYEWGLNEAVPAAPLANSPAQVVSMLVAAQDQVFALGCNEEASGSFNPLCIRHSGVRASTVWHTGADTTAREYILPGGGRIVAGRTLGPNLLVWTTHALFLGSFVGSPGQVWRFDRVGEKCGLASPNAVVVVGQAAYWLSPDLQFRRYGLGGAVEILPCPILLDMADNLLSAQIEKIAASSNSKFGEIRFDYPDARDGGENSRYVAFSYLEGAWHRGEMARTAMVDAGPQESPIGVTPAGLIYWHERGESADGAPIAWSLETADQYVSEDNTAILLGVWPDVAEQRGAISLTVTTRLRPQGDARTYPPSSLAPGQGKVDLRARGRLFRLRFSGASSPSAARIGRIVVQFEAAGAR